MGFSFHKYWEMTVFKKANILHFSLWGEKRKEINCNKLKIRMQNEPCSMATVVMVTMAHSASTLSGSR